MTKQRTSTNTLQSSIYKEQINQSYYLALRDLVSGVSYRDLVDDLYEFEQKEMYEVCAGILKALNYAKEKTYKQIKIELNDYEYRHELNIITNKNLSI